MITEEIGVTAQKYPQRWWITRKMRMCLIRVKDCIIYQMGGYPTPYYSIHHKHWVDGMLKKESKRAEWTERWDALFGRWQTM